MQRLFWWRLTPRWSRFGQPGFGAALTASPDGSSVRRGRPAVLGKLAQARLGAHLVAACGELTGSSSTLAPRESKSTGSATAQLSKPGDEFWAMIVARSDQNGGGFIGLPEKVLSKIASPVVRAVLFAIGEADPDVGEVVAVDGALVRPIAAHGGVQQDQLRVVLVEDPAALFHGGVAADG